MSAYVEVPMAITDRECLIKALEDVGFNHDKIMVHTTPQKLQGFRGDRRANNAEIIIPRKYVGPSSNDLGFKETATGYKFIVSSFDRMKYGSPWISGLVNRYKIHYSEKLERLAEEERKRIEEEKHEARIERKKSVMKKAKQMGYMIKEETVGKQIQLVLIRREY